MSAETGRSTLAQNPVMSNSTIANAIMIPHTETSQRLMAIAPSPMSYVADIDTARSIQSIWPMGTRKWLWCLVPDRTLKSSSIIFR